MMQKKGRKPNKGSSFCEWQIVHSLIFYLAVLVIAVTNKTNEILISFLWRGFLSKYFILQVNANVGKDENVMK